MSASKPKSVVSKPQTKTKGKRKMTEISIDSDDDEVSSKVGQSVDDVSDDHDSKKYKDQDQDQDETSKSTKSKSDKTSKADKADKSDKTSKEKRQKKAKTDTSSSMSLGSIDNLTPYQLHPEQRPCYGQCLVRDDSKPVVPLWEKKYEKYEKSRCKRGCVPIKCKNYIVCRKLAPVHWLQVDNGYCLDCKWAGEKDMSNEDAVKLSVLRWFKCDVQNVTKADVLRLLELIGVDHVLQVNQDNSKSLLHKEHPCYGQCFAEDEGGGFSTDSIKYQDSECRLGCKIIKCINYVVCRNAGPSWRFDYFPKTTSPTKKEGGFCYECLAAGSQDMVRADIIKKVVPAWALLPGEQATKDDANALLELLKWWHIRAVPVDVKKDDVKKDDVKKDDVKKDDDGKEQKSSSSFQQQKPSVSSTTPMLEYSKTNQEIMSDLDDIGRDVPIHRWDQVELSDLGLHVERSVGHFRKRLAKAQVLIVVAISPIHDVPVAHWLVQVKEPTKAEIYHVQMWKLKLVAAQNDFANYYGGPITGMT